jgi:branched-chain amino acid transport system permease protein
MIVRIFVSMAGLVLFFAMPQLLPEFRLFQICLIAATAVVVLGQVVVTGFAGQISLAQAAFVGLGGYGPAILATSLSQPLWFGIPFTAVVVGFGGFVLGQFTLRVSGHYLALATLAVTSIVQLALVHSDLITGGAAGMAMPPFSILGVTLTNGGELYYLIVPVTVGLFLLTQNVMRSRFGRGLAGLRQSETAAESTGLDLRRYKAMAFAASGFLGSIGGSMLALLSTYLDPTQFGITQSIYYLAIAVVGGMLSTVGIVIASAIFIFIPEWLQAFQSYLGLVFALLLLGFIVLRPDGLASLVQLRLPFRVRGKH